MIVNKHEYYIAKMQYKGHPLRYESIEISDEEAALLHLTHYNQSGNDHDFINECLTFEAIEDGTFKFTNQIKYSIDNGSTWNILEANTNSPIVIAGSTIMWKAELKPNNATGIGTFNATGNFNVYGNIMSLLYDSNIINQTNLVHKDYAFKGLFSNNKKLINAENLILPAEALSIYCYAYMFSGCSNLIQAPELPSITLANYCYKSMFSSCTSLTIAPELPATILASYCYQNMFWYCTSLTTAPQLPATTLATNCYDRMFESCTSLTTVPSILPATTLANYCYQYIFYNCTSLTTAPELPATTLVSNCYSYMFSGCKNLNLIKCAAIDISASNCTYNWVSNVATDGKFYKNSNMNNWIIGTSGMPNGWALINYTSSI